MNDEHILKLFLDIAHDSPMEHIEKAAKANQVFWHPDKWRNTPSPEQIEKIKSMFNLSITIRENAAQISRNKGKIQAGATLLEALPRIGQFLGSLAVNYCLDFVVSIIHELGSLGKDEVNFLAQIKKIMNSQTIEIMSLISSKDMAQRESSLDSVMLKINNIDTKKLLAYPINSNAFYTMVRSNIGSFVPENAKEDWLEKIDANENRIKAIFTESIDSARASIDPIALPETIPIFDIAISFNDKLRDYFDSNNSLEKKNEEQEQKIIYKFSLFLFERKYKLNPEASADEKELFKSLREYIVGYFGQPSIIDRTVNSQIDLTNLTSVTPESHLMTTKKQLLEKASINRQPITNYLQQFELIESLLRYKLMKAYKALYVLKNILLLDGDAARIKIISEELPSQLHQKFVGMQPLLYSLYNSHGNQILGEIKENSPDNYTFEKYSVAEDEASLAGKEVRESSYNIENFKYNGCYLRNDRGYGFFYFQSQVYCDSAAQLTKQHNWQIIRVSPESKFFVIKHQETGLYMTSHFCEGYRQSNNFKGGCPSYEYTFCESVILDQLRLESIWSIELTDQSSENHVQLRAMSAPIHSRVKPYGKIIDKQNPEVKDTRALLHANSFFNQVSVYRGEYNSDYEKSRTWVLQQAQEPGTPKPGF